MLVTVKHFFPSLLHLILLHFILDCTTHAMCQGLKRNATLTTLHSIILTTKAFILT